MLGRAGVEQSATSRRERTKRGEDEPGIAGRAEGSFRGSVSASAPQLLGKRGHLPTRLTSRQSRGSKRVFMLAPGAMPGRLTHRAPAPQSHPSLHSGVVRTSVIGVVPLRSSGQGTVGEGRARGHRNLYGSVCGVSRSTPTSRFLYTATAPCSMSSTLGRGCGAPRKAARGKRQRAALRGQPHSPVGKGRGHQPRPVFRPRPSPSQRCLLRRRLRCGCDVVCGLKICRARVKCSHFESIALLHALRR